MKDSLEKRAGGDRTNLRRGRRQDGDETETGECFKHRGESRQYRDQPWRPLARDQAQSGYGEEQGGYGSMDRPVVGFSGSAGVAGGERRLRRVLPHASGAIDKL